MDDFDLFFNSKVLAAADQSPNSSTNAESEWIDGATYNMNAAAHESKYILPPALPDFLPHDGSAGRSSSLGWDDAAHHESWLLPFIVTVSVPGDPNSNTVLHAQCDTAADARQQSAPATSTTSELTFRHFLQHRAHDHEPLDVDQPPSDSRNRQQDKLKAAMKTHSIHKPKQARKQKRTRRYKLQHDSRESIDGGEEIDPMNESGVLLLVKTQNPNLDDGYVWRKYGRKDIKGEKKERTYWKCKQPGCEVTKHIQKCSSSKDDYVSFAYFKRHTHHRDVIAK